MTLSDIKVEARKIAKVDLPRGYTMRECIELAVDVLAEEEAKEYQAAEDNRLYFKYGPDPLGFWK